MPAISSTDAVLDCLRANVERSARREGRTDSAYDGLRFYRFSAPVSYRKRQVLVPGVVVVLQGSKQVVLADETLHYDPARCPKCSPPNMCDACARSAATVKKIAATGMACATVQRP